VAAVQTYAKAHDFAEEHVLLRLDGQYGTGAVLADLAGLAYVTRGKDYRLLDPPEVQARLHLPSFPARDAAGKRDLPRALRLSGPEARQNRKARPPHRRDSSRRGHQESGRGHACRRRL
jgi:hypothetical protein